MRQGSNPASEFLREENEHLRREIEILKEALLERSKVDHGTPYSAHHAQSAAPVLQTPYSQYGSERYGESPTRMEGRYTGLQLSVENPPSSSGYTMMSPTTTTRAFRFDTNRSLKKKRYQPNQSLRQPVRVGMTPEVGYPRRSAHRGGQSG